MHGVNGIWGLLALGLFADGSYGNGINGVEGAVRGLFYGGSGQFWAQFIDIGVVVVWGFGASWLFWKLLNKILKIRVSPEVEIAGLDLPETGVLAYPDFVLTTSKNPDGIDLKISGGNQNEES